MATSGLEAIIVLSLLNEAHSNLETLSAIHHSMRCATTEGAKEQSTRMMSVDCRCMSIMVHLYSLCQHLGRMGKS